MYKDIQKVLDWGVKVASLAITGPATWVVATALFDDITNPLLLFTMRFAAVFLIEGVLLSNWLLLEFDRTATPEIKARYGFTALAMYISLLVIGFQHEGPTGLVFRIALLAALIGSGWDTYVYTWQKATRGVDRSVDNSRKVKRHARRLAIKEARMVRDSQHALMVASLEAGGTVGLARNDKGRVIDLATIEAELVGEQARITVERDAEGKRNSLYGERLVANIHLDDKAERLQIIEADERMMLAAGELSELVGGDNGSSLGLDIAGGRGRRNGKNNGNGNKQSSNKITIPDDEDFSQYDDPGLEEREAVALKAREELALKDGILEAFVEDPRYTRKNLALKLGISEKDATKLVHELVEDDVIYRDKRAYYLNEESHDQLMFRTKQSRKKARTRK